MSSPFSNRRKARKVGEEDEQNSNTSESEVVVKRPTPSKQKQKSKLRLSFGPGETSMVEDDQQENGVVTPKRPGPGRRVLENNTLRRALQPSLSSSERLIRVRQDQDRPSYNEDYIKELRNSTPSAPRNTTLQIDDSEGENAIDIAAKFGEVMEVSGSIVIPSEAEIREKKARRARLAKEQDFISLDDGDDNDDWYVDGTKTKPETRLVRDDEDFAEGFEEFVEDPKIALGRKAEREQERRQRETVRELIDDAEDISESDESDAERRAAYEATQTQAAVGRRGFNHHDLPGHLTPPRVTPLPHLANSLERLRSSLAAVEASKKLCISRLEELRKEKADIAVREVETQTLIRETGENYEKLRIEAGIALGENRSSKEDLSDRGLESLVIAVPTSRASSTESD